MTDARLVEVRRRLAAMARPDVSWAEDILAWWESLPPARHRYVAALVLDTARPTPRPARRLPAASLDESVREAVARYDINPRSLA